LALVTVAVPVPVTLTLAVAVAVEAPGAYCTTIVQLAPGFTTAPETQVPPVAIEKVPPVPPTLLTAGLAVRVRGAVAVAAFVTVIVPVSVAVLAGVVASAGAGAEMATVAPVTVNGIVFVVPIGVVRPMFRIPSAVPGEITRFAVTVLELTTVRVLKETPPPRPVTADAPVRLAPVKVTGTVVPRTPVFGAIDVSVAPCTVNGTVLLVPPGVVTLTLWAPSAAPPPIVKVAFICVGLMTVTPLTATPPPPPPETATVVAPVMKLVPVNVTDSAVARTPVGGAIEVNVGAGGTVTVKVTALLVPPGAVTVTFLAVAPANALITKFAVTWLSFTTVMVLTVMPPPDTLIAVVPVRPLPKRLTATVVPRLPETGEIEVSTGPVTV
jgi:hypothetical protein